MILWNRFKWIIKLHTVLHYFVRERFVILRWTLKITKWVVHERFNEKRFVINFSFANDSISWNELSSSKNESFVNDSMKNDSQSIIHQHPTILLKSDSISYVEFLIPIIQHKCHFETNDFKPRRHYTSTR